MAKQIIARIKLAPGEVGYYDDCSRIHLTMGNNTADIYSDTDCTRIKRSVASGRLLLISGSFTEPVKQTENMLPPKAVKAKNTILPETKEVASVEIIDESPLLELHEEIVDEQDLFSDALEITEEVKPKKRSRRKKNETADETTEIEETVKEADE